MTVCCWYSLKRGIPIYLPTVDHPQGVGVLPYLCAGDFPSVGRSTAPADLFHGVGVPQSKACLQGGNESLPPSAQMAVQPGGVLRFTIALNGAFCFRTYPLLRISWYRGVPFWNPFIWWPKIRLPKTTAQFCALVHKPLHIRRGVPNFGETQSITAFFICTQHKNKPLCAFSVR